MEDEVRILFLDERAVLPARSTGHAAGYDLTALLDAPTVVVAGERVLIPTGLALELPLDMEAQVRPRSGLAVKHGITVLNAPGTIDADYRGEVRVALINHGKESFTIEPGMRIAQLVFARVSHPQIVVTGKLSQTGRGEGGFGHSGV